MLTESEKIIIGKLIMPKKIHSFNKQLYKIDKKTIVGAERFFNSDVFLVIGTVQDIFKPIVADIMLDAYFEERNNFVVLYYGEKRCFGNFLIGNSFYKNFDLVE